MFRNQAWDVASVIRIVGSLNHLFSLIVIDIKKNLLSIFNCIFAGKIKSNPVNKRLVVLSLSIIGRKK